MAPSAGHQPGTVQGASFENMRMPAYGGSLFDPDRFPFLIAVNEHKTLALPVSDRVMLHVLESVQVAHLKGGEARHISFRDIDVEQIGYIYEGLLGYSCEVVHGQVKIGLRGTSGEEPEIGLDTLDELRAQHVDPKKLAKAIIDWVKEDQPPANPRHPPRWPSSCRRLSKTTGRRCDSSTRSPKTIRSYAHASPRGLVSCAETCAVNRWWCAPASCW